MSQYGSTCGCDKRDKVPARRINSTLVVCGSCGGQIPERRKLHQEGSSATVEEMRRSTDK